MTTAQNYLHDFELTCKSGKPYPAEWTLTRLPALRDTFNVIRSNYGRAVRALCGYRDPDYNVWLRERSIQALIASGRTRVQAEAESGVAKNSQHIEGRAIDIVPLHLPTRRELWTPSHFVEQDNFHESIETLYKQGKLPYLGGLGKYPRWSHIDTRLSAAGGLTRWTHS